MIEVVRSNRLEALVEALAQRLDRAPLHDPMQVETIAVPSRGMERWLAQRLSQRLGAQYGNGGICAHVEFPFPAKVVRRLLQEVETHAAGPDAQTETESEADASDPWEPDAMAWAVLDAMGEHLDTPAFAPLARYLGRDAAALRAGIDRRAYTLARAIARVFDNYDLHRPRLVQAFAVGAKHSALAPFDLRDDETWQPLLWQAVLQRLARPSFAARLHTGIEALRSGANSSLQRISVFGVAALPAAQLAALDAVSQRVKVTVYLLAPSDAYWADIRARRDQLRALGGSEVTVDPAELELIEGHPLLTSLGVVARDFQVVLERSVESYRDAEIFIDPAESSLGDPAEPRMLEHLQSDMLRLRNRGAGSTDGEGGGSHAPTLPIAPGDDSIEVHACHGDTRQVEVLRDRLLAMFEADPTLQARDVLVMSPDIERFAPLIPAVFSTGAAHVHEGEQRWGASGTPKLPFYVADRTLASSNPVAAALLELLDLAPSRMPASRVLDFLSQEVVRARFDIEAEELQTLRAWTNEAGARWGVDAEHRASFGAPAQTQFTWRFALDRLALGVAMRDEGQAFGGQLPFDDVEGSHVQLLGRLLAFTDALFESCAELTQSRALDAWGASLYEAVDRLFATTEGQRWWSLDVRRELDAMLADAGDFEIPVELAVVHARLSERLSRGLGAVGHHTGAITFCAMAPMRSVPHKVVCLLGMSDGVFPRSTRDTEFDLLRRRPNLGDPNPRNEDRFLMLEAILAARDKLLITYEGRDARRNQERPPCVPVAELLDQLTRSFEGSEGADLREQLVTEHALAPHDPRYFSREAGGRQRFDRKALAIAEASVERKPTSWAPPAMAGRPSSIEASALPETVTAETLSRELCDCPRTFLRHRVGARLPRADDETLDRETLGVQGLAGWKLRASLVQARWAQINSTGEADLDPGLDPERIAAAYEPLSMRAQLPPGPPGRSALRGQFVQVQAQWARLGSALTAGAITQLQLSVPLEATTLLAQVHLGAQGQALHVADGKAKPKRRLRAWVEFLCWQSTESEAGTMLAAFEDRALAFTGLTAAQARTELEKLVALWRLSRERPLAFLPRSGWELISSGELQDPAAADAMRKAAAEFHPNSGAGSPGEVEDPSFQLVWGPVTDYAAFVAQTDAAALAQRVFGPLVDALEAGAKGAT